ncbi:GTP-dependent dephospho-CoA kinase family protein [Natronorarus salvus]|uniref:GTP-dependent dephospho-CoA kinase family protein n=1 Tax=Natronorarus salvus TaxID=3117733 RepID=UPI002F26C5C2
MGESGSGERGGGRNGDSEGVVLTLPEAMRGAFKDPLGPVFTEGETLLSEVDSDVIAVGDVVTAHLVRAGRTPDIAVVDWLTERDAVGESTRETLDVIDAERIEAANPAATVSHSALSALREALDREGSVLVVIDGEEDLLTLPVLVAAPLGTSVVYGQPGEGMVHVRVTEGVKERARGLIGRMDGDHDAFYAALGIEA